jgi:hypothetical protein
MHRYQLSDEEYIIEEHVSYDPLTAGWDEYITPMPPQRFTRPSERRKRVKSMWPLVWGYGVSIAIWIGLGLAIGRQVL